MNKFAIVGCEASGKTVFMSALCDRFREALVPENAAANRFARFAARQLRALRQWPPATPPGKAIEMTFTLRAEGRPLAELGLLEFGGETFRAAFREEEAESAHKRAVHDLMDFLGDADFILVLVSLKEIFRDPGTTPLEVFERDTESIWVTRGLLEFIRKKVPGAHVVLGLSQADRYAQELEAGGGAERVLAKNWPSIYQLISNLRPVPVIAIASVSATDSEGRPAEGFTTNGILPVLREFALSQFATPEVPPCPEQNGHLTPHLIRRYKDALRNVKAIALLTQQPLSSDVLAAEGKLPELERQLKELRARVPKRTRTKRKAHGTRPRTRRVFWLTLLLASVVYFADAYYPRKSEFGPPRSSAPTTPPAPTPAPQPPAPPFRLWHDHRGKAIEARWIDTAKDQKSITLETRNGRRIRAVLYKLSDEDRAFVTDALKRPEY